jgi:dTDP-4-amino-4,6-dideoxygalactose transaminase
MRDLLQRHLTERGVQTLIHYPEAVHQQPAYKERLPAVVPLEHTEIAVRRILSLPMYPELSLTQQQRVIESCAAFVGKRARMAA